MQPDKPTAATDTSSDMDAALTRMRQAESAHFDAVQEIRDAETLRLYALKQDIEPLLAGRSEIASFVSPALYTGTPPRLWIDLTSYVVMAPNPRTFRLVQDTADGHQILAETIDRSQMVQTLRDFIAHRTVVRQRELGAVQPPPATGASRYSTAALILAWLAGFSLGVLALLAVSVLWLKGG